MFRWIVFLLFFSTQAFASVYRFTSLQQQLDYLEAGEYNGAPADALAAIADYIYPYDDYYSEINNFLRFYPAAYDWNGVGPDEARKRVALIDSLFAHAPKIPNDIVLFRGERLEWRKNRPFEINEIFSEKAYSSSSVRKSWATYFARGQKREAEPDHPEEAVLALYFNHLAPPALLGNGNEEEVMLPHGLTFKVMAKKAVDDYGYYLVQICDEADCCESAPPDDISKWWRDGGIDAYGDLETAKEPSFKK